MSRSAPADPAGLDGGSPDGRTAALIGLTDAAGLLHRLFPRATQPGLQEIVWRAVGTAGDQSRR